MPKKFEDMVSAIKASLKKDNPGLSDKECESKAYAMATAQWKKMHNGKLPEGLKDWRVLEFYVPITEARMVGNDFIVKGVAINETTTRNGIKYIAAELENAAPTFRNKPILLDHKNEVKNIVGRTTENVVFNATNKRIEFEAKVMDKEIQNMISDGRITDVSIGASVKGLSENKEEGSRTAIGLEGHEISFVAVPGDPNANLAMALDNCFMIKEKYEEYSDSENENPKDEEDEDGSINNDKTDEKQHNPEEDDMRKMIKKQHPDWSDKDIEDMIKKKMMKMKDEMLNDNQINKKEVIQMEEKTAGEIQMTEMNAIREENAKMKAELDSIKAAKEKAELIEKIRAEEKAKLVVEMEASKVIAPLQVSEDKTKGEVSSKVNEVISTDSLILEKAETGKGFQIWKDFSKDNSGKFKRLIR